MIGSKRFKTPALPINFTCWYALQKFYLKIVYKINPFFLSQQQLTYDKTVSFSVIASPVVPLHRRSTA